MDMNLSKLQERVKDKDAWHASVHGVTKSQTRLSDWKTSVYSMEPYSILCNGLYVEKSEKELMYI